MSVNPIIPIWLMILVCAALVFFARTKDVKSMIRRCLIIFFIFLIDIRIMVPSDNVQAVNNDLDVLFVVDNTISMLAEDYNGSHTRLEGVKKDCEYILQKLAGARFSVIKFSNDSQRVIPYVKDANLAYETIEIMKPLYELYARGTTLNTPLEDMKETLKAASEKGGRKQIVFFISDGEITNEEKLKSFSGLKKYIDNGAVLGYGTQKGGQMKVTDYWGTTSYLEDKTDYPYKKAISQIDEKNLKSIANDMGIDYIQMDRQSNINSKLQEISILMTKENNGDNLKGQDDIYFIFAIPLSILLVWELIYVRRRI